MSAQIKNNLEKLSKSLEAVTGSPEVTNITPAQFFESAASEIKDIQELAATQPVEAAKRATALKGCIDRVLKAEMWEETKPGPTIPIYQAPDITSRSEKKVVNVSWIQSPATGVVFSNAPPVIKSDVGAQLKSVNEMIDALAADAPAPTNVATGEGDQVAPEFWPRDVAAKSYQERLSKAKTPQEVAKAALDDSDGW